MFRQGLLPVTDGRSLCLGLDLIEWRAELITSVQFFQINNLNSM